MEPESSWRRAQCSQYGHSPSSQEERRLHPHQEDSGQGYRYKCPRGTPHTARRLSGSRSLKKKIHGSKPELNPHSMENVQFGNGGSKTVAASHPGSLSRLCFSKEIRGGLTGALPGMHIKNGVSRASLMVYRLKLQIPSAGGPSSIPLGN